MADGFIFGARSLGHAAHVEPLLIIVVGTALNISELDFSIIDGLRTPEEQRGNIRRGVSWTMDSEHLPDEHGLANAVDLLPYTPGADPWANREAFQEIGRAMRVAAARWQYPLEWGALKEYGGDWTRQNDMAHFQRRR